MSSSVDSDRGCGLYVNDRCSDEPKAEIIGKGLQRLYDMAPGSDYFRPSIADHQKLCVTTSLASLGDPTFRTVSTVYIELRVTVLSVLPERQGFISCSMQSRRYRM